MPRGACPWLKSGYHTSVFHTRVFHTQVFHTEVFHTQQYSDVQKWGGDPPPPVVKLGGHIGWSFWEVISGGHFGVIFGGHLGGHFGWSYWVVILGGHNGLVVLGGHMTTQYDHPK